MPLKAMMALVADKGPAGRMLRGILPITMAAIFIAGVTMLLAYRYGYLRVGQGTLLFSVANGVIVTAAMFWSARLLQAEYLSRREAQESIRNHALHDPLTGLANRGFFMDQLARRVALADRRTGVAFAVCSLELDGFQRVTQQFGSEAGNRILVKVGEVIRECVRASDAVARLEGGKFGILLEEIGDAKDLNVLAQRIVSTIPPALEEANAEARITVSIGIALRSGHAQPGHILREADAALALARKKGPGHFELTAFSE